MERTIELIEIHVKQTVDKLALEVEEDVVLVMKILMFKSLIADLVIELEIWFVVVMIEHIETLVEPDVMALELNLEEDAPKVMNK